MSVKQIVFAVLCVLLVLVFIMTGVTVAKVVQLFSSPDDTQPPSTDPSTSAPSDPSTTPSSEATTPSTEASVPPSSQPTESTGSSHTHNYTTVLTTKEATCTDSGYREMQCACGETKWDVLDKRDHSYGYGETIPVTCDTDGCARFTCSVCGHVEDRNIVEKLGHLYDSGVFHEATCTDDAYTEFTCSRSTCTDKVMKQTEEGTAIGHDFGDEWLDDGTDVLFQICDNCNATHTTDDLKVTQNIYLTDTDAQGNLYKLHEIHVGTQHVSSIYTYKITDYVSTGALICRYRFEDGLSITYTNADYEECNIQLESQGGEAVIGTPAPDSSDPTQGTDPTDPSEPSQGNDPSDPTDPTSSDPTDPT